VLRDEVAGQPQGAVVPLLGEFVSGAHRGRFSPKDGQLYITGMGGWGTYTPFDGCFQRVRRTSEVIQLPSGFHVHENGILVKFTQPVDREMARQTASHFAQSWNYRYSSGYGSPEFSPRHPGTKGHDPWTISAAHVLADGRSIFLELPDLQPVNQLHLHLRVNPGAAHDLFVTVHKLDGPFRDFPGYTAKPKVIAAHPILADLALATAKKAPNPWGKPIPGARTIVIEAGKNLTFATRAVTVKPGEAIRLTLSNPDVVPHNWVLIKPGTVQRVGDLANKLVADPEAAVRHYVPVSRDVLAYTDIVQPYARATIYIRAPMERGRYPFLCTFPGHWMVMNGQMNVE
jgi:azurin